jgi:hypothetical protein
MKIVSCDYCEKTAPENDMHEVGDPRESDWGLMCDQCGEAAHDNYMESLHS